MKKLLMVIPVFVLLAVSNSLIAQVNTASTNMATTNPSGRNEAKEMRNKQAALASMQAYNTNNLEAFYNNFDKDFVFHSANNKQYKGLDTLKAHMARYDQPFRAAFPDLNRTVLTAATDGDYVTLWEEGTGTWKGDFQGMKPNGKSFKVRSVTIFKFNEAGKIIAEHQITNPYQAVGLQVGMVEGVEGEMNNTGYKLLTDKKVNEAIEVFKLNTKLYPNAWNTFDSLGEAYAMAGNKKLAIENYEKSMKLNPQNENGRAWLAKLKAK
jgi:steroid delta-isomerase-like uncharacterized protein